MSNGTEYATYHEGVRVFRHNVAEKPDGRSVAVAVWGEATPKLLASLDRAYERARADLVVAIAAAEFAAAPASREWW